MKIYLSLLIILIFITSCKKESVAPPVLLGSAEGYDNSGTYLPLTKGYTWTYIIAGNDDDDDNGNSYEYNLTGKLFTFNGIQFTEFTNPVLHYLAHVGNKYFLLTFFDGGTIAMPILDEDQPAGVNNVETTTYSFGPGMPTVNCMLNTSEKNTSKTINGKVYNDVISTLITLQDAKNPFMEIIYGIDFAKGIGVISYNDGQIAETLKSHSFK